MPTARQIAALLGFALLAATATALWHPRAPGWRDPAPARIAAADALRLADAVWVDARPRAEFDRGHHPGAVPLNEDDWQGLLDGFLDAWEPGRPVVVYCGGADCRSSEAVAERLRREAGLEDVRVVEGGWTALEKARP